MDPIVGQLLSPRYDLGTVALSYVISFFGSLLALLCAHKMVRKDGTLDLLMLAGGAVALGGIGIWSMHFIGMVAYRLPVAIAYDVPLVALSLLAAMAAAALALCVASRRAVGPARLLAAGTLMGAAIAAMHYTGMRAMRLQIGRAHV